MTGQWRLIVTKGKTEEHVIIQNVSNHYVRLKLRVCTPTCQFLQGEVLEEEIEARGMTQKELAARLGKPAQAVNEIIKGKKAITPDTAIGLGKVLGISPHFWSTLEADYRMTLARNREQESIAANVQWLDEYPIREMIKRGWIQAGRDKESKLEALLSFLGVADARPQVLSRGGRLSHYRSGAAEDFYGCSSSLAPQGRA